jgi:hypothetical protein
MLEGHVEVDETYIGGKARNMNEQKRKEVLAGKGRKNAWAGKVAVMRPVAAPQREGQIAKVRTFTGDRREQYQMRERVKRNVMDGSALYTGRVQELLRTGRVLSAPSDFDHAEKYAETAWFTPTALRTIGHC